MKKHTFSLLLLLLMAVFSCQSSKEVAQKSIDETMNTFFKALEKQDFEAAKKLSTPYTQDLISVLEEDAKKYKEFNDKPKPIKVEFIERQIEDSLARYKVRILVGESSKEKTIRIVSQNNVWLLDMPEEHIVFCRSVLFFDNYDNIITLYNQKYGVAETPNKTEVVITYTHRKITHKKKNKE